MSAQPQSLVRAVLRRPYATVPLDIVTDASITLADRTVLVYMLAAAAKPNWTLYVAEVTRRMGLSHGGWRACRRRLEAAGYYRHIKRRCASGRWEWEVLVTDTPHDFGPAEVPPAEARKPESGQPSASTILHSMTDGDMTDRFATGRGGVDKRNTTHRSRLTQQQHGDGDVSGAAAAPSETEMGSSTECRKPVLGGPQLGEPKVGRPNAAQPGRKRLRTHTPTGAVYWLDDEPAELDMLVENFGLTDVRKAVTSLVEKGTDPLYGRLRAALLRDRREQREADVAERRRRGPTASERAEDARLAREAMDAFAAQRDAPEPQRVRETRSVAQILEQWRGRDTVRQKSQTGFLQRAATTTTK